MQNCAKLLQSRRKLSFFFETLLLERSYFMSFVLATHCFHNLARIQLETFGEVRFQISDCNQRSVLKKHYSVFYFVFFAVSAKKNDI